MAAPGLNINLIFTTFVVVFGCSFLFGYNIGVLNLQKDNICEFFRGTHRRRSNGEEVSEGTVTLLWSLTTALFIPGGMIGSLLGGWLNDTIGRKRTMLLSQAFTLLGAALSAASVAAGSPELLMVGRLLFGVHSGLGNCAAPMILSEIPPFTYRGAFGVIHQLTICIGLCVAAFLGFPQILGTEDGWPFLMLIEAVPALFMLAIVPFLPDTPRYLLLVRKDRESAVKAMQFYRKSKNVDADMEEMDTEAAGAAGSGTDVENNETAATDRPYTVAQLFTDVDIRRPLFIACMLVVIQQFSGINAVFFYSQSIFENAGVAAQYIPFAVLGINIVNIVMTLITVPLMDVAGRRPLLIYPTIVMIIDLTVMTICLVVKKMNEELHSIGYVSVACVIVYVICFAAGLGSIPWLMGTELFRQGPRPKAMALVGIAMWVSTFIIAMGFEPLQSWAGQYTFVVFIVLLIGFAIFMYFFVPETKNKTFDEIAREMAPKSKRPDDVVQMRPMAPIN